MDRGGVTHPEFTGWGREGAWMIEGHGTDPDTVIVNSPGDVIAGRDPQLDAAIDYLLEKIENEPIEWPNQPPYPVRKIENKP